MRTVESPRYGTVTLDLLATGGPKLDIPILPTTLRRKNVSH